MRRTTSMAVDNETDTCSYRIQLPTRHHRHRAFPKSLFIDTTARSRVSITFINSISSAKMNSGISMFPVNLHQHFEILIAIFGT